MPIIWTRVLLASTVATLITIIMPLLTMNKIVWSVFKMLICFMLPKIYLKSTYRKIYLKAIIVFSVVSILLGGAIFSIVGLFGDKLYNDSIGVLCVTSIGALIIIFIVKYGIKIFTASIISKASECSMLSHKRMTKYTSMIDTGNTATYKGKPVIVVSSNIGNKIDCTNTGVKYTLKTLTGEVDKELIIIPRVIIGRGRESREYVNVFAMIVDGLESTDVILHSIMNF